MMCLNSITAGLGGQCRAAGRERPPSGAGVPLGDATSSRRGAVRRLVEATHELLDATGLLVDAVPSRLDGFAPVVAVIPPQRDAFRPREVARSSRLGTSRLCVDAISPLLVSSSRLVLVVPPATGRVHAARDRGPTRYGSRLRRS